MNIELHIEELVLRGLGNGQQHEIRAAMERELIELMGRNEMATPPGQQVDLSRVDAGSVQIKPSATGQAIGAQLAQSVYQGILK